MKFLNIVIIAAFALLLTACGGDKAKKTHVEESESIESEDIDLDEDLDEELEDIKDEWTFFEAAMTSLDNGDYDTAATQLNNSLVVLNNYNNEEDDAMIVEEAIEKITEIIKTIKKDRKMTSSDLEEEIESIAFFQDDELEIDDESIDE